MKLTTIVTIIVAGLLLLAAGFALGRVTLPTPGVSTNATTGSAITAIPTADFSIPELDVEGEPIPGLPRYPGMRRVEYRQVILGDLLETEAEYVMTGELRPVHDYYRQVFEDEGWIVVDLHIFQGEWTFFAINGDREALVELESRGPLVEVEIELTEPLLAGSDTPDGG